MSKNFWLGRFFGLAIFAGLIAGCSLDSTLTGLKPVENLISFTSPSNSEIVSGSQQYANTTSGNYKVSVSVGSPFGQDHSAASTTAGGYKVYVTVQGQVISEGL